MIQLSSKPLRNVWLLNRSPYHPRNTVHVVIKTEALTSDFGVNEIHVHIHLKVKTIYPNTHTKTCVTKCIIKTGEKHQD